MMVFEYDKGRYHTVLLSFYSMTAKTHLDMLLDETSSDLGKKLVAEFIKLLRDPDVATTSYPVKLRALLDEQLQGVADAAD